MTGLRISEARKGGTQKRWNSLALRSRVKGIAKDTDPNLLCDEPLFFPRSASERLMT